jgi:2-dehydro-3-deoxyglucarate aldolase
MNQPGSPASLKQRLRAKQITVGSWLSFDYAVTAEIMARAGFPWLVIDMEHTATSVAGMHRLLQIIDLAGCVPLVRVGANDPLLIKRALDSGAHGIIVPMVNSRAEADRAVQAAYYPPRGTRGVGLWRAQGHGTAFDQYRAWAERETLLVVQIEHHQGVAELEEILAVEGVDGFVIGPYDLSGSFNDPGNFASPRFLECLAKVERFAREHPKPAGYHIVHPDAEGRLLQEKIAAGYTFIAYGTDMVFFSSTIQQERNRLRQRGL